ncbi:RDD family protein [Streptomyces odontomachi]|uniref:RDD family protein n=1 Tax=Streptomyces odontomachi TaxID=2944940 RepID=UPI00210D631F|nr:RDD family protein [Streptomyces sp. ODS25]
MSNEPPSPGPGRPPEDDEPFRKPPPPDRPAPQPTADTPRGSPRSDASGTDASGTGPSQENGPGSEGGAWGRPGGAGTEGGGPSGGGGYGGGTPYGGAPGGGGPPPGGPFGGGPFGGGPQGGGPHGGGPYGGGPYDSPDPLAGMAPLAPSGKRVLARIIDMIIVGIVAGVLSFAFGLIRYHTNSGQVEFGRSIGESVLVAVLYMAYDTYLISRNGQTFGKRLLHMRVANLNDGATPSVQVCLTRAAVLWLPFAFCCAFVWTVIAGGWSFFDRPYKQGLHDKAAKTVVVSTQ